MNELFFCSEEPDYKFSYLKYIDELTESTNKKESKIREPIFLGMNLRELELDL